MIAAIQASSAQTPPEPTGVDWWFSIAMGLVEGVTEFLPVSSTGHLIITSHLFNKSNPSFEVGIQLGAISAILLLYRQRLVDAARAILGGSSGGSRCNLLVLILVAAIPAAVVGLLFEKRIEAALFNNFTVGCTLILGGIALWGLEILHDRRGTPEAELPGLEQMSPRQALWVGVVQCLALIPGTSRSGASIAGGMLCGLSRTAAAEFSFLVGLPILYGAGLLKLVKDWELLTAGPNLTEFVVATAVSFVSAALVVGPFVRFLQKHSFRSFAVYRVAAGILILVWLPWFKTD